MTTISTLTVDVTARTARFRAGMRTVGLGLAAVGAAAFAAFREFEKNEQAVAQTAAVLKSTGGAANVTAKGVTRLTDALMRKTAIDDETIRAGANMLLTFTNIRNEVGKGNRIFDRATATITDMSVALDQDFKSSAIQLGKALNDPIRGITALRRVGVSFTEAQEKQIAQWVKHGDTLKAQRAILDELTKEFGGSAEAQVTGSKKMATALGELAETAGQLLAPAFTFLAEKGLLVAQFLQQNLGPALAKVRDWLRKVWQRIGPVVSAFGRELMEALQQTWAVITEKVWPALQRLFKALQPVLEIVGKVAGAIIMVALEAIPVIVEAIGVLIDWLGKIITWVGRVIKWVKDRLVGAWNVIKGPVLAVIGAITSAVATLVGWIKDAVEWLAKLAPDKVEVNPATLPGTPSGNPFNPFSPGNLPGSQHGGPVPGGMPRWVGEAGPEIFVPRTAGTVIPNHALAPSVQVFIGEEEVQRIVVRALNRAGRRS